MSNILVIKLGALGDFIYALGPMKAIREFHRQDKIILLTTKPFLQLAKDCNYFDEIIIDEKPKWNPLDWLKQKSRFQNLNVARVYDLQNNDRTANYFKLFPKKTEWVGAVMGASHRNASPERIRSHAFLGHRQTLALAGIGQVELDNLSWMNSTFTHPNLRLPYVLLGIGSAPSRLEKRWPVENYAEIAGLLLKENILPVIIGGDVEKDIGQYIINKHPAVLNLIGQTKLNDLPTLARRALAAIGNDTGPMHIISVTGCKTLMLFCSQSSTVQRHGPQGQQSITIEKNNLNEVSAEEVWEKFKSLYGTVGT